MSEVYVEDASSKFIAMARRDIINIAILGAIIGLVVWVLDGLLDKYVFQAIMCQAGATRCGDAPQYAAAVATILGGVLGLTGLLRLRVFRPLLIVILTVVSLWGLSEMLISTPWYWALLAIVLMYALAYTVYTWLARIRSFLIAAIAMVVLVVIVRLTLG